MERLSIDEAIKHAKETAERKRESAIKIWQKKLNNPNFPWGRDFTREEVERKEKECIQCAEEHEQLAKWLEKLKEYEDAEENGLLLRLPCKVGDTAWVIDEDFEYPKKKKIYEAKWVRVTFVQVSANCQFELRGEVSYQVYDCFCNDGRTMSNGMYVGQTHTKVGEVVFLTKEEAEKALKQMGE